jgi:hypothetical protein
VWYISTHIPEESVVTIFRVKYYFYPEDGGRRFLEIAGMYKSAMIYFTENRNAKAASSSKVTFDNFLFPQV